VRWVAAMLTAAVGIVVLPSSAESATKSKGKRTTTTRRAAARATTMPPTTLAPAGVRGLTSKGSSFQTPVRVGGRPIRIMPLGDELAGGAVDGPQSYRGHLYNSLIAAGYQVDLVGSGKNPTAVGGDPDHEGHGAYSLGPDDARFCEWPEGGEKQCLDTPFNLASGIGTWLPEASPDVVIITAGLYDLFEPDLKPGAAGIQKTYEPDKAPAKLRAFVAEVRRLQPDAVIVVTALARPTWITSGWKIYENFNAEAMRIGEADPNDAVLSVNLSAIPLAKTDYADGFHVNSAGAAKLAQPLVAAIEPVLKTLQA
jgi:hypothetical protein